MKTQNKKIHFAWWMLLGLVIIVGFARGGINNAAGLFLTPVSTDLGVGIGQLTLYLSIASVATMVFLPIAGKMMAKYDIRLLLVVSIILQAGCFSLFGLMNSVWGWYLLSVPMSFGAVFLTQMAGPVLINQWFKKKNGLALGIMMAAVGLFGAIIQPAVGKIISAQGWRTAYFILGLVSLVVVIPVILLLIRKSPQHKGLLPYGATDLKQESSCDTVQADKDAGVTAAVARKSFAFVSLLLFFFFITAISSFAQHIAPYAISVGYDVAFSGKAMGVFMVGVLIGSLAFGFLSDKMGTQKTAILAMVVGLISIVLLIAMPRNATIFSLAICLFGFVSASTGTLGPLLTTAIFGTKEYSQIYATTTIGLAVAGIVALPCYGFVYDLTGSYKPVLFAVIMMLVINIALILSAFKGKKKLMNAGLWE